MSTEDKYLISKSPQRPNAEDYRFLRAAGIEQITKLSGKIWTDYNIHDPGITILELLCYALTDLGYRTSFPINDLLTRPGSDSPDKNAAFYTAKEILPSHPVTINDYRRYIIDSVPGVRNIWLDILDSKIYSPAIYKDEKKRLLSLKSPYYNAPKLNLKGLYNVRIEIEDVEILNTSYNPFLAAMIKGTPKGSQGKYTRDQVNEGYRLHVREKLLEKRNLCEDFHDVTVVNEETVAMCADIELTPQAKTDEVLTKIFQVVYHYINPTIPFYTIDDLLKKGKPVEEIFEGTMAHRGFIDADELAAYNHRETIYVSDVINLLMDIEGVRAVREIHFNSYLFDAKTGAYTLLKTGEKYSLKLSDPANASFRFYLDYDPAVATRLNKITFHKGHIYFPARFTTIPALSAIVATSEEPAGFSDDLPFPTGSNRQVDEYYSFQHDFPKAYMTGKEGIPDSATSLRKAQRLQLKGYLLFFDQLLADYLAQLDSASRLLSWQDKGMLPSYCYAALSDDEIVDFGKIFKSYDSYQGFVESEETRADRRNRLLDHLLARFNERFADYSLFRFSQITSGISYNSFSDKEKIADKTAFLDDYPLISSGRSHAVNYLRAPSADNTAVLEKRICRILGINKPVKQLAIPLNDGSGNIVITGSDVYHFCDNRLAPFDQAFGFHIVEHIMLRPLEADNKQPLLQMCGNGVMADPANDCVFYDTYSMRMTVLVPGWLGICGRMEFRKYIEQQFRLEAPAHTGIKICWVNPKQMYKFEKANLEYLAALLTYKTAVKLTKAIKDTYIKTLGTLVDIISGLHNMYPPARLDSCDTMEFDLTGNLKSNPVILGSTALSGTEDYVFNPCGTNSITQIGPLVINSSQTTISTAKSVKKTSSKGKKQ